MDSLIGISSRNLRQLFPTFNYRSSFMTNFSTRNHFLRLMFVSLFMRFSGNVKIRNLLFLQDKEASISFLTYLSMTPLYLPIMPRHRIKHNRLRLILLSTRKAKSTTHSFAISGLINSRIYFRSSFFERFNYYNIRRFPNFNLHLYVRSDERDRPWDSGPYMSSRIAIIVEFFV